jgi:hypothetical protein
MVLYESHSIIHSRPFPLKGEYFASIFVHFEPLGHTLRHSQRGAYDSDVNVPEHANIAYQKALEYQQRDHAEDPKAKLKSPDLPSYVNIENEVKWRQHYEFEKEITVSHMSCSNSFHFFHLSSPCIFNSDFSETLQERLGSSLCACRRFGWKYGRVERNRRNRSEPAFQSR